MRATGTFYVVTARGPRHAGLTATGELRRSDFGIAHAFPAPVLGDVVKVELDLELLEPES